MKFQLIIKDIESGEVMARGYACVHEYDGENGELLLIVRKTA